MGLFFSLKEKPARRHPALVQRLQGHQGSGLSLSLLAILSEQNCRLVVTKWGCIHGHCTRGRRGTRPQGTPVWSPIHRAFPGGSLAGRDTSSLLPQAVTGKGLESGELLRGVIPIRTEGNLRGYQASPTGLTSSSEMPKITNGTTFLPSLFHEIASQFSSEKKTKLMTTNH